MTLNQDSFARVLAGVLPENVVSRDDMADAWWDSSLIADLGLDSLATIGLIAELEDEFDVEIPDTELTMGALRTPRTLFSMMEDVASREQPGSQPSSLGQADGADK